MRLRLKGATFFHTVGFPYFVQIQNAPAVGATFFPPLYIAGEEKKFAPTPGDSQVSRMAGVGVLCYMCSYGAKVDVSV